MVVVRHPAGEIRIEPTDTLRKWTPRMTGGQSPNGRLEPLFGLTGQGEQHFSFSDEKREPEELPFLDMVHCTFLFIHGEFELL